MSSRNSSKALCGFCARNRENKEFGHSCLLALLAQPFHTNYPLAEGTELSEIDDRLAGRLKTHV